MADYAMQNTTVVGKNHLKDRNMEQFQKVLTFVGISKASFTQTHTEIKGLIYFRMLFIFSMLC